MRSTLERQTKRIREAQRGSINTGVFGDENQQLTNWIQRSTLEPTLSAIRRSSGGEQGRVDLE